MKRRNFLASLLALPFAVEPLHELASRSAITEEAGNLFGGLFDSHKRVVESNAEALRRNTEALLRNVPKGFKREVGMKN